MVADNRLQSWIRLVQCEGLGPRALHALLSAFGSPEVVLDASASVLSQFVSPEVARAITSDDAVTNARVEATLQWALEEGNHLLTWDDARYPRALLDLVDPPPLLFCKGDPLHLDRPALAMVGSRNASPGGLETAEQFAEAFALAGINVISGLALGIDAAAHRGALKAASVDGERCGSTVAVIGTGIDRVYPSRNRDLAHGIATLGAIVSEFPLETPPLAFNFPRRNRLISGLARGVLVVEAVMNSGSLITARFAGEQGKDVFAIPGSIHSPFSKGCHRLIKDGAKLVETANDVLEELGLAPRVSAPSRRKSGRRAARPAGQETEQAAESSMAQAPLQRDATDPEANNAGVDGQKLLDALGYDPVSADEAIVRSGLSVERVLSTLLQLELAGTIARLPGDRVQRVR